MKLTLENNKSVFKLLMSWGVEKRGLHLLQMKQRLNCNEAMYLDYGYTNCYDERQ